MTVGLRLAFVAMVVVAVLPPLVVHRPPPLRIALVRTGATMPRRRRDRAPPVADRHPAARPLSTSAGRPFVLFAGVGVCAAALAIGVVPSAALVATVAAARRAHQRAARRRDEAAFAADLPEVADLLVVAIAAGLTVPLAVEAVGRRGAGPLARRLAEASAEAATGRRLVDVLDELPTRAGEPARPLAAALVACLRDGAPVLPTVTALAVEAREHERRRVEQAARRVPVLLLFPLVLCVLPAFALLTVAPLVADALTALRL